MHSFIFAVALPISLILGPATAQESSGRQIAEMVDAANRVDSQISTQAMTLVRGGQTIVRQLQFFSVTDAHNDSNVLVRFLAPEDVRGTGLLRLEIGGVDQIFLFLPALGRTREIRGSDRSGSFVGSDFSFSDLGSRDLDDYDYELLRSDTVDGQEVYVLESVPATDEVLEETGNSRRVALIRKDILLPVRVEFYDQNGELEKVLLLLNIQEVASGIFQPNRLEMTNVQETTSTILEFSNRQVNMLLPEDTFTVENLEQF
ncbi:MAG: outer membrane lipoprotein-sorting protein [Deinococcus sp.]|nr:outer membrane lipoprotein-sorting protein [Deinococcus sp.]